MQPHNLSFYDLGIAPKMLEVLQKLNFESPTPVQHSAIPIALEGKDVVAVAQTGTGKTLAFGIPMVQRLAGTQNRALVLAPTRDLVLQVHDVFRTILEPFGMRAITLIGGEPMGKQISQLKRNHNVIIATPGRLIDHIERRTVNLNQVTYFVLDEADRMLDMGFAPQVNRILKVMPTQRQTLLFSATMPTDIVKLASEYMKMPIHVEINIPGKAATSVTQELFIIREENKSKLLTSLLYQYKGSVLLFARTIAKTKQLARKLNELDFSSAEIHSDRSMRQRKQAIDGFKAGRFRVLVATDVAARGIDVKNIEVVINYDLPDDIENYVHRIGRSGRAGQKGHAITFAAPDQSRHVRDIEKLIKASIPKGVHEGFTSEEFDGKRDWRPKHKQSDFGHRGFNRKEKFNRPGGGRPNRSHSGQGSGRRREQFSENFDSSSRHSDNRGNRFSERPDRPQRSGQHDQSRQASSFDGRRSHRDSNQGWQDRPRSNKFGDKKRFFGQQPARRLGADQPQSNSGERAYEAFGDGQSHFSERSNSRGQAPRNKGFRKGRFGNFSKFRRD